VKPEKPRARWGWRLLVASGATLVVVALLFDAWDLARRAWEASSALGALVGALVLLAIVGALKLMADELRGLFRLGRIDALRRSAAEMLEGDAHGGGQALSAEVERIYAGRADLARQIGELREARSDQHDEREVVRLIDSKLMQPIDRAAYQEVLRASRDTALGTAVSPSALLDMLLMAWRSLRLIRRIGQLYGVRPGALVTGRLLRRSAANAFLAGGMEAGDGMATEALGGTVVAAISTRISQGLLNGLLTARLGLAAMEGCRPIPFSAAGRPRLSEIRKALLQAAKQSE